MPTTWGHRIPSQIGTANLCLQGFSCLPLGATLPLLVGLIFTLLYLHSDFSRVWEPFLQVILHICSGSFCF